MKMFAISDLHLSFSVPADPENWDAVVDHKPMDVCSPVWKQHYKKIYYNWHKTVSNEDIVFVPGDISWAMKIEETVHDMHFLSMLPGMIIAIPGNHDYWWHSISKVRKVIPPNMQVIQNDHIMLDNIAICGTRGWVCPNNGGRFDQHDEKIYKREIVRLENSLSSVKQPVDEIIVMMHYMPTNEKHEQSGFIDILKKYNVNTVIYGHLHARAQKCCLPKVSWGINFHLVSADYLNFTPVLIREMTGN